MKEWVLDCSISSAFFLPDEGSGTADLFFNQLDESSGLFVPLLWWQETGNVLINALKRKRVDYGRVFDIFLLFDAFPIETVSNSGKPYLMALFELSRAYDISTYDAAYLELAMSWGAGLATLDTDLQRAAGEAGARVWKVEG